MVESGVAGELVEVGDWTPLVIGKCAIVNVRIHRLHKVGRL